MIILQGKFILLMLVTVISCNHKVHVIASSKVHLHLIIGLPLEDHDSDQATAAWERGSEILPGAHIAVKSINNREDILSGYELHATEVTIGRCGDQMQNDNFLLQFINITYHQDINLIGAVGIFCPTKVQIILQPPGNTLTLLKANLKAIVEATANDYCRSKSGSCMIQALLEFLDILEWRNIAAVTETKDRFFSDFVEKFHRASVEHNSNFSVAVYNYSPTIIHQNLPRIVLMSIGLPLVVELLCSAYREGLVWPKHVWIIHTFFYETIANLNASCDVELALENVLFFSEELPMSNDNSSIMPLYSNKKIGSNFYSLVLHDLVWSVALVVNDTLQGQFRASCNLDTMQINIVQVRHSTTTLLATYSNKITVSDSLFIKTAPSDKLLTITEGGTLAYTVFFTIEIVSAFIFVTIMLIGYSCFRNEPEVKSTSFSLSLLVFLGCYLLLVYVSILLYFHQPWLTSNETLDSLCISLNWFSGLGISTALILATALVKILRIYHIFSKSTPTRLSKRCSDTYLVVYVLLLISPLLFVHILWTTVDPYLGYLKISVELNVIQIQKQCNSKYKMFWYALLTMYMLAIFAILLIMGIKMRKIQESHFKDTKKVIIFVVSYFTDIVVGVTLWQILYNVVNAYYAAIVSHIGHITAIIICQLFLFTPKILPPLARYVKANSTQDVKIKCTQELETKCTQDIVI